MPWCSPLFLIFLPLSRLIHSLPNPIYGLLTIFLEVTCCDDRFGWVILSFYMKEKEKHMICISLVLWFDSQLLPSRSQKTNMGLIRETGVSRRSHNFWQLPCKLNLSNLFMMASFSIVESQSERKHSWDNDLEKRNSWALPPASMSTTSVAWMHIPEGYFKG